MKIQDKGLKDKMMGYMKGKPEMEGIMPMVEDEGPAMETPEMLVEKTKTAFSSWSADEKLSFLAGLMGNTEVEVPEVEVEME